jgi:hypothetical protein
MADTNQRRGEHQTQVVDAKTILNCNLALITFKAKVKYILNKRVKTQGVLDRDAESFRTAKQWTIYKEDVERSLYGMLKCKTRRPSFFHVIEEILKLKKIDEILNDEDLRPYRTYVRDRTQKEDEMCMEEDSDDEADDEEWKITSIPYKGLHDKEPWRLYSECYTEYPVPKGPLGALTEVFEDLDQELAHQICPQPYWLGLKLPEDEYTVWKIMKRSECIISQHFVRDLTHLTLRYLIKHLYIRRSCLQALERLYKKRENLWCAAFDLPPHEEQPCWNGKGFQY